jgi:PKD repeat protein
MVQFHDTTAGTGGLALSQWTFGDGQSQQGVASPMHSYTEPGTYTVRLDDSHGGDSWTVTREHLIVVTGIAHRTGHGTRARQINRALG